MLTSLNKHWNSSLFTTLSHPFHYQIPPTRTTHPTNNTNRERDPSLSLSQVEFMPPKSSTFTTLTTPPYSPSQVCVFTTTIFLHKASTNAWPVSQPPNLPNRVSSTALKTAETFFSCSFITIFCFILACKGVRIGTKSTLCLHQHRIYIYILWPDINTQQHRRGLKVVWWYVMGTKLGKINGPNMSQFPHSHYQVPLLANLVGTLKKKKLTNKN